MDFINANTTIKQEERSCKIEQVLSAFWIWAIAISLNMVL